MAEKTFKVKVISPERVFYEGEADMIELITTEGEIGVLPGHIPLTTILKPGVLRIALNGEKKEAALHEGFVEILPESVTILAEACEWPDEIDINRANEAKIRAERRIKSGDSSVNLVRAEMALYKSLIRLELARKYS